MFEQMKKANIQHYKPLTKKTLLHYYNKHGVKFEGPEMIIRVDKPYSIQLHETKINNY